MVACALIPRFELIAAVGERRELLGRTVAIAPAADGPQVIGEASGAAEAFGVKRGMRLGEALARCPALTLLPADPQRSTELWEGSLERLESIGAGVEPAGAGEAFFGVDGLRGIVGSPQRVLDRARKTLGPPVRMGAGPVRLAARAAAQRSRPNRRSRSVVDGAEAERMIALLEVSELRDRLGEPVAAVHLIDALERLGVKTLGEMAALPDAAVADRFGRLGLRALGLARGEDSPLRPREPFERLRVGIELPEAIGAMHLERALELLVDRLLASRRRRGRGIRRLRLEARLAAGGGWLVEVTARSATAEPKRLLLLLAPKLATLPAPASRLWLSALELGEAAHEQQSVDRDPSERRRSLISEAVRQARAAAGSEAIVRVLDVDPGSGVPERRVTLTPFEEDL